MAAGVTDSLHTPTACRSESIVVVYLSGGGFTDGRGVRESALLCRYSFVVA